MLKVSKVKGNKIVGFLDNWKLESSFRWLGGEWDMIFFNFIFYRWQLKIKNMVERAVFLEILHQINQLVLLNLMKLSWCVYFFLVLDIIVFVLSCFISVDLALHVKDIEKRFFKLKKFWSNIHFLFSSKISKFVTSSILRDCGCLSHITVGLVNNLDESDIEIGSCLST